MLLFSYYNLGRNISTVMYFTLLRVIYFLDHVTDRVFCTSYFVSITTVL